MNSANASKQCSTVHEHCTPTLQKIGFQFYQEQHFDQGLVSLPAFAGVRISYVHKGFSKNNATLNAGDLLINGLTPFPLYGDVSDFSMASIGLHFTLLYRLCGLTPKECRFPLRVSSSDPIYSQLLTLFYTPQEQWEKLSLFAIRCNESKLSKAALRQMERVDFAIKVHDTNNQVSFDQIAIQMGISYRQLQRDFHAFLGITPTEYERANRFRRAVHHLKKIPPVQASVVSGYYDQTHMIKEFKMLTGRTPKQIMNLQNIDLPQLYNI